jgi:hypothetical protein
MRSLWFALKNSFKNFSAPNLIYPWLALGVALFLASPAMGQFTPPSVTVKSGFVLQQNVPLKLTDMFNITPGNDPLLRLISVGIVDRSNDWQIQGATYVDTSLNGQPVKAACMGIEGSMPNFTCGNTFSTASLVTSKPPGSVISFGPSFFGYTLACPNYPDPCERLPFGSFGYQIFPNGLTLSLTVGEEDADRDTFTVDEGDCNDNDPAIHPDATEICDGVDDNCNGTVDEGNPGGGASCAIGLPGVCSLGTLICTNGELSCQQTTQPFIIQAVTIAESCNGVDDNCNGTVDEGNPGGGASCTTGLPGVCGVGTSICTKGGLSCQQTTQPSAESCDGLDNNCNGTVDEGPDLVAGGACNTCKIPGLDLSIIENDPEAKRFEQSVKSTGKVPEDSLERPAISDALFFAFLKLNTLLPDVFTIDSGYRPPAYQEHFRDIRETWGRFDTAVRRDPSIASVCKDRIDEVMAELRKTHGIRTACRPDDCERLVRPGEGDTIITEKGISIVEGTPLVNVNSAHSFKPSRAIDLVVPRGLSFKEFEPSLLEAAKAANLKQICGKLDRVHFSMVGTKCDGVTAEARSPVNIMLRDPLGRRVGYDPVSAQSINEIGDGVYYSGPDSDPEVIEIEEALPGDYDLTSVGTGNGPYTLILRRVDEEGEYLTYESQSGVATPGSRNALSMQVPLEVDVDIKPGGFPNSIQLKSRGKIPTAVLSTETFDAFSQVDGLSLTFGHTGDEGSLDFCNAEPEDVNGDGLADLVCHFFTQLTQFQAGDTEGILKGHTVDGMPFQGTDLVRVLK